MKYETLELEIDGRGVAALTLNRPEVRNAFNDTLIGELHAAINELGSDKNVRAILLAGAGKSFSAGADLNWMKAAADYSIEENEADAMRLSDMLLALNMVPKPVIARVHGSAFGGGVGLTACADIALATVDTTFALSEVRLGLLPATISPFVIAAIGERAARAFFLTGTRFDGAEAERLGLVHDIASDEDGLDELCEAWIGEILKSGPKAVAASKKLISAVAGQPLTDALRRNTAERIAARRASDEGREGMAAFFEHRKADWNSD